LLIINHLVYSRRSDYLQRFLFLCAGRIGQQINLTNLANETDVDHKTVQSWLGVLQASYIVYTLPLYFENFNKRLTKSSKLYFYDTGLACYLLGIRNSSELSNHGYRGALFENFIVLELLKNRYNKGQRSNLYYWRDSSGNEVDVLIDNGSTQIPVEIKSGGHTQYGFFQRLELLGEADRAERGAFGIFRRRRKRLQKNFCFQLERYWQALSLRWRNLISLTLLSN
jgi:uncharacterized protein